MRIGVVQVIDGGVDRGVEFVQSTAVAAEELGYSTFWLADHLVFFDDFDSRYPYSTDGSINFRPDQGIIEPLLGLCAAALATTTIRLGTAVEIAGLRHPIERAKQVATLDVLSGGRFTYGVGLGWLREEYEALGIDFSTRGRRTDEMLAACRALWAEERPCFAGDFFRFEGVIFNPKPVQQPSPPVLVGGVSRAALRRAARNDGWFGWNLTLDELDTCLVHLDEELDALGRDRTGFHLILGGQIHTNDGLQDYLAGVAARGIEEFAMGIPLTPRRFREQLEHHAALAPTCVRRWPWIS